MRRGQSPVESTEIVARLREMQAEVRRIVLASRAAGDSALVMRRSDADTIYAIDTAVEPAIESFCRDWAKATPLVLIAEGLQDEHGRERARVFPEGVAESDAEIRIILDPIDGTRGLMYDKRSAWSLAGVAPNRGPSTGLRDIEVAVMTELPTSKLGWADVLWAVRGQGASASRIDLRDGSTAVLAPRPSTARSINHGFATVSNFFPGTKVLAGELVEFLVRRLVEQEDVTRATVFDDQYISTAGQWYELMVGHDRFNADLRPAFYGIRGMAEGMCCHPYDCAALLIAEEAGVIITGERGRPLNAPLDTTTGINWLGYANAELRRQIEPLVQEFLGARQAQEPESGPA
jgi:fructose-1,6-bisphosphatase/inositol monophosphatase family enzyme